VVLLTFLLSACATTPPFSDAVLMKVEGTLTPEQAVRDATHDVQVLWGGVIIGVVNLPDHTDVTVLFYPLGRSQRPDPDQSPQNRFIVRYSGFLETTVYARGREITVLGSLQGVEDGKVGDAPYRFPVIKADKVHLWAEARDSRVHFGVGLGIGWHM